MRRMPQEIPALEIPAPESPALESRALEIRALALVAAISLPLAVLAAEHARADEPADYAKPMQTMMDKSKAMHPTGDADADFAMMMVPHHEGAVDMARIEFAHGRDPALRRLARRIIASQQREIAEMNGWLAAHGH